MAAALASSRATDPQGIVSNSSASSTSRSHPSKRANPSSRGSGPQKSPSSAATAVAATTREEECVIPRDSKPVFIEPLNPGAILPVNPSLREADLLTFLWSSDEVKVFSEEGEEDVKELHAALLEEKSSLIQETECGIKEERLRRIGIIPETGKPGKRAPSSIWIV